MLLTTILLEVMLRVVGSISNYADYYLFLTRNHQSELFSTDKWEHVSSILLLVKDRVTENRQFSVEQNLTGMFSIHHHLPAGSSQRSLFHTVSQY